MATRTTSKCGTASVPNTRDRNRDDHRLQVVRGEVRRAAEAGLRGAARPERRSVRRGRTGKQACGDAAIGGMAMSVHQVGLACRSPARCGTALEGSG